MIPLLRTALAAGCLLFIVSACGSDAPSSTTSDASRSTPVITTPPTPVITTPPTPVITTPPTPVITTPPTPVVTAPPTSRPPDDQARAQNDKASPFTSSSPEVKACLQTALGNEIFVAIASGARTPTDEDNRKMSHCLDDGATTKSETPSAGRGEAGQAPAQPSNGSSGGGPFTSGSPEVKACLQTALGNEIFVAIASGARTPTDEDNRKMSHCLDDGATTKSETPSAERGEAGQAPAQPSNGSSAGGPFTSGSPEVKACLRTALGNELFTAIAAGTHTPTDDDNQKMGHCLGDDKKAQAPATGLPAPGPVATTMDRFLSDTSQPSVPARRYAAEIVSIGETRYIQMHPLLADVSYVASLQAWGANTWRVIVHYESDSDGNILWSRLPQLETAIVTARTNGLAVLLSVINFRDEFSGGTTAENRANLYAQRQAAALDLARFAERLNIEYFSPINEAEGILDNEAYGDGYGSPPVQERVGAAVNPRGEPSLTSRVGEISTLFESMAPHLRSVYSGRLVAHFGTSHPDYRVPSYDYIGITLDHHKLDPGVFRTVVGANLDHVAAAARASGTKWMVEETYFFWSEVADPEQTGNRPHERKAGEIGEWEDADEVAQLRELQDDYFRISLEEYAARAGGSGYDAGGWLMPGVEISGSPAETILQEFFAGR